MSALIVGCLAASGGAMIGLWIGATLTCGRAQDLEMAYRRLRSAVDRLLDEHEALSGHAVLSDDMADHLGEALQEADLLAFPELVPRRAKAA
jgi:hypothetical protein